MIFIDAPLPGFIGSLAVYACSQDFPAPIGFLWLRFPATNYVEVLYIFVHEDFRRKGVASSLVKYMKDRWPGFDIIGAKVNEHSKPLAEKHNFRETPNGWVMKGDR